MQTQVTVHPKLAKVVDESTVCPQALMIGAIDDEAATRATLYFANLATSPQPYGIVVVDSYGGSVYSLLGIVDSMFGCGKPVMTIGKGKIMSAGAILCALGTVGFRVILPRTTVMYHNISAGAAGTLPDMGVMLQNMNDLHNRVTEELMRHCKIKKKALTDLFKDNVDKYIAPEDLKGLGLVDHIGFPSFKSEVSLNYTFELDCDGKTIKL